MKKIYIIALGLLITACSQKENHKDLLKIKTENQTFYVELAETVQERQKGLMYRDTLPKEQGMLFVLPYEDYWPFWMKNTFIPLDVIWISQDKKVTEIQTLPPCKHEICPAFQPKERGQFILEVNAGQFKGEIGDTIEFDY